MKTNKIISIIINEEDIEWFYPEYIFEIEYNALEYKNIGNGEIEITAFLL